MLVSPCELTVYRMRMLETTESFLLSGVSSSGATGVKAATYSFLVVNRRPIGSSRSRGSYPWLRKLTVNFFAGQIFALNLRLKYPDASDWVLELTTPSEAVTTTSLIRNSLRVSWSRRITAP